MTDCDFTVLDHIDNIKVPGRVFAEPANEYWALTCLHQGLAFLYRQAAQYDRLVTNKLNPDGKGKLWTVIGTPPALDDIPKGLLTCAFHWYAISACQYVRTVGAIAYRQDNTCPLPEEYAEKVLPEVVGFRDKVAAHFAGMTRNSRDNEAERLASIMPQLGFSDDSLCVSAYTIRISKGGQVCDSTSIKQWSIPKVHEQLQQRYWPDDHEGQKGGQV